MKGKRAIKTPPEERNRVWIELESPESPEHANTLTVLVNRMLARLNDGVVPENTFWWSKTEGRWCYGGDMGYIVCVENGQWFNLNHLGRPL